MEKTVPPEGLGGVGNHSNTQLDGLADRKGQVLVSITEICQQICNGMFSASHAQGMFN